MAQPSKVRVTEIWYSSEVKLSKNYQTAGATVGMKAVIDKREDEKQAMLVLKKKVKLSLSAEVKKITDFLEKAAN